jgi:hypothetical protein
MRRRHMVSTSCLFILVGCATIAHSTEQTITIKVTPSNAKLTVDGKPAIPGPITLTRGDSHRVIATCEGYNQAGKIIEGEIPGAWLALYVVPSCLVYATPLVIPLIVDLVNGAIETLPESVDLILPKATEENAAATPENKEATPSKEAAASAPSTSSPPLSPPTSPPVPNNTHSEQEPARRFCSSCGAKLTEGARFCSGCGAAVK